MKIFKKILGLILIILCVCLIFISFVKKPNLKPVKGQLMKIDLNGFDKLMIVSHPGDESVFGGANLIKDNYLVVCVSCGYDVNRENEFIDAVNMSGDKFVMLGYSDKIYTNRNYKKIYKQIKYILNYKKWDMVVTHNPLGENGNYQHKQISDIVSSLDSDVYYFGKYYSKGQMNKLDKETTLNKNVIKYKINMVKVYDGLYDDYKHILPFEDWIRGSKWKN